MKILHCIVCCCVSVLVLCAVATGQASEPPAGFRPGFDDIMTMLVQPRHLKLFYAAEQRNWELAAFQLKELRASLRRAAEAVPKYQGDDVAEAVQSLLEPAMQATGEAITAGDSKQFAQAFAALTDACNACHSYMEHPFLIMRVPKGRTASPYPDQNFGAR